MAYKDKNEKLMKVLYQNDKISIGSVLKNNFLVPKRFKKLPFEKIKNDILGSKFELSIVFVGKDRSRTLNKKYAKKDYPTDVLSFKLSSLSGEIFITPSVAKVKAKKSDFISPHLLETKMDFENYLLFLVIHAMLHLKGMLHSSRMEQYEFTHYSRYRYRHIRSESSRCGAQLK